MLSVKYQKFSPKSQEKLKNYKTTTYNFQKIAINVFWEDFIFLSPQKKLKCFSLKKKIWQIGTPHSR